MGRQLTEPKREHTFIYKCEPGERRIDIAKLYWIREACQASPKKEAGHD